MLFYRTAIKANILRQPSTEADLRKHETLSLLKKELALVYIERQVAARRFHRNLRHLL